MSGGDGNKVLGLNEDRVASASTYAHRPRENIQVILFRHAHHPTIGHHRVSGLNVKIS